MVGALALQPITFDLYQLMKKIRKMMMEKIHADKVGI
jgi:hypothetical protein